MSYLTRQNESEPIVSFPNERTKVIVIGAGASGIGAARAVYKSGYECIVLEARDRIGGRVHKAVMQPNLVDDNEELKRDNTVTVQLGANWIHGLKEEINPMFAFAKQLGLLLHKTSSDDAPGDDVLLFDEIPNAENDSTQQSFSYKEIDNEDYKTVISRYDWIREHFDEVFATCEGNNTDQCSLLDAFQASIKASELIFGKCSELQYRCLNWLLDRVAIDMANPLSAVHPHNYIEGDSCGEYGEAVIVSGGFYHILDHLTHEFPIDVRLNSIVRSIQQDSETNLVTVTCSNGQNFTADSCIVTVPVGVLKHQDIEFTPSIPRCIESVTSSAIDMGLMNLVWLWYPYQFWPDGYNFFGIARSSLNEESMFTTFLAPNLRDKFGNPAAILMCQVIGPFAERAESMTETDLATAANTVLRNMFSSATCQLKANPLTGEVIVPSAIGCKRSQWRSEPFSTGSWSYFPMHSSSSSSASSSSSSSSSAYSNASDSLSETSELPFDVQSLHSEESEEERSSEITVTERCSESSGKMSPSHSSEKHHQKSSTQTPTTHTSHYHTHMNEDDVDPWREALHYAGEAMNEDFRGTVHGAFLSGTEKAQSVVSFLSHKYPVASADPTNPV